MNDIQVFVQNVHFLTVKGCFHLENVDSVHKMCISMWISKRFQIKEKKIGISVDLVVHR